jgi:hypothetical protein
MSRISSEFDDPPLPAYCPLDNVDEIVARICNSREIVSARTNFEKYCQSMENELAQKFRNFNDNLGKSQ